MQVSGKSGKLISIDFQAFKGRSSVFLCITISVAGYSQYLPTKRVLSAVGRRLTSSTTTLVAATTRVTGPRTILSPLLSCGLKHETWAE